MSRIPDFSQIPFQQAPAQGDAEFAEIGRAHV